MNLNINLKVIANGAANLIVKRSMGPFWIRRRWLEKTQWLSKHELEQIQLQLLRKLIRHCYSSVPYYTQLMNERGITVDDINALDDIKLFPILTKIDVLKAGYSLVSRKYPKWLMRTACTGGTTGTPMKVNRSLFSISNEHAFVRRQWDWAGLAFADRCAWIIAGRKMANPDKTNGCLYAYDPFMKELTLSAFHLYPGTAKIYLEAMNRYRVKAIVGIASAVYFLAKVSMDSGMRVELKAALTTSETLTEIMRETISEAFRCKVFDYYGAAERVCYIHTCEHKTYHIVPEYGYTELIPLSNPNTNQYKIIATGFWNMGMPLIRYDTGDIVTKSEVNCPCGRAFSTVKFISGRQTDIIRTPSGRIYGPTIVARVLKGTINILESQIIQDALNHITIKYVPNELFSEQDLSTFKKHVRNYLTEDLNIDIVRVATIPRTNTGKTKLIVSKI